MLPAEAAMTLLIPIGISDFRELRERGLEYVDKSHLITELLDQPGIQVALLPRPRRFGKTLNLSMLRYFFEKRDEDLSHLFEDLAVWQAGEAYRAHFQRYPVVFLTFRDIKSSRFEECWADLKKKIEVLFREHEPLLDAGALGEGEARDFRAILDGKAEPVLYRRALGDLTKYLHRATGEKVIVLIDEYDEPIHAGHVYGYAKEVLEFFRSFLTAGLKDNPHLSRGVVTGILRIARESIFSGLNNLAVCSLLMPAFSTCFGFTEPEVTALLEKAGQGAQMDAVRAWYNGYSFGGEVIYNPWSVLNFLQRGGEPKPYWLSTSSNDLIRQLLQGRAAKLEPIFEAMLEGGGIERILDENVVLDQLARSDDALWSLLVFSGYLKAEARWRGAGEQEAHFLTIPNREVRLLYTGTFRDWLRDRVESRGGDIERMLDALLAGDAAVVEKQLQLFATDVLSYHDATLLDPEQVYQAFVLGLLAAYESRGYRVRSNRESGEGRPDVLIIPKEAGKPGVVLELKVVGEKVRTPDKALAAALSQVEKNDYAAELRAVGAAPIRVLAVAFNGKRVWVRAGTEAAPKATKRAVSKVKKASRGAAKRGGKRS